MSGNLCWSKSSGNSGGFFKTYSQRADVWLRFLIRNLGKSRKAGSRLLQSHRIHTPALCERFSKRRFAVFKGYTKRKVPGKCRISKTKREGHFFDKKQPFHSQQNSTTKETRLATPNRTDVPLPEVYGIFRSKTISVLSLKFPCHPLLKSCICPRGLPIG